MSVRLSIQKIVIDIPVAESDPWVQLTIQRIEMDDDLNTLNVVDRWRQIHRRISDVALEIQQYHDPVLGVDGNISVAGLTNAITAMCRAWTSAEFDGTLDANGYVIVS